MAGRIPQDYLDHLLSRVDLVELVQSRTPLRRAGREFVACCPFHTEKTPSFAVSPAKQFYHCFGCGVHGTAIGFLMAYDRLEFRDAVEELARYAGVEPPQSAEAAPVSQGLFESLRQADLYFRRQLRQHPTRARAVDYLRQRGVSGVTAQHFGLGYAPPGRDLLAQTLTAAGVRDELLLAAGLVSRDPASGRVRDRFWDRIIFPIRDRRGRTLGFGGRTLAAEGIPKYLNSPETPLYHKGLELYGLYEARTATATLPRLLVVEGYLDVLALVQYGLTNVVATSGTALTAAQIERLFRATGELVFCFDGDQAGRAAAWRALETALPWLSGGRNVAFLFLPEGEDPDSLVRQEGLARFNQRLSQATPLADYLFDELRRQSDPSTLAGRARLAALARPLLEKLPDDPFRELLSDRLLREAGLGTTRLRPAPITPVSRSDQRLRLIRTPLRKAIALLLYRPELAQQVTVNPLDLRAREDSGLCLLADVLDLLRTHPTLSAAALLERYRDTREGAILARLAAWEPEGNTEHYDFGAEFSDILDYLRRQGQTLEPAPDIMLRRGAPSALSREEREAVHAQFGPKKLSS